MEDTQGIYSRFFVQHPSGIKNIHKCKTLQNKHLHLLRLLDVFYIYISTISTIQPPKTISPKGTLQIPPFFHTVYACKTQYINMFV